MLVHRQPMNRNAAIDYYWCDDVAYEVYRVTPDWFYVLVAITPDTYEPDEMRVIVRKPEPLRFLTLDAAIEHVRKHAQIDAAHVEAVRRRQMREAVLEARAEAAYYEGGECLDVPEPRDFDPNHGADDWDREWEWLDRTPDY